MKNLHTILSEKVQKINIENLSNENQDYIKSSFENYNQEIGTLIKSAFKWVEEIENSLKTNEINRLFEDSPILNYINEFKDYLSTLSVYELCILMDILLSIFILTCLITILFSFYGNYLIKYLSLETKYLKLSSIIKLRVKLQHFYIVTLLLISYIFL